MSQALLDIWDFATIGAATATNLRREGAYGLQYTTALGMGCETASWSIPALGNEPITIRRSFGVGHDIWLTDNKGCVWRGKMSVLRYSERSKTWNCEAHGYGKDLGSTLDDVVNARNTSISDLINISAISALTTMVDDTDIDAAAHTISNAADVLIPIVTAGKLIAWASRFDIDPEWYLYPEDDGTRLFTYRPRPSAPTIYLNVSAFPEAEWGFEDDPLYNTIKCIYDRAGTLATPTYRYADDADASLVSRYGALPLAIRMWELVASSDADAVVAAALSGAKYPRMSAISLVTPAQSAQTDGRTQDFWIASKIGGAAALIQPHRLRAGELMSFVDMEQREVADNTDFNKIARISRTTYDEDSQQLSIEPENFTHAIKSIVRRFEAQAIGFTQ